MPAPETAQPGPIASPLALARTYIGRSERSHVDRELIQGWLAEAGYPGADPSEMAWCGAFAHHVVRRFPGLPYPSQAVRARSWLQVGTPIPAEYLHRATPGWIVLVLSRGVGRQPGPEVIEAPGHVGLWSGFDTRGRLLLVAGNQGDAVSEGAYDPARLLGIRSLL